MKRIAVLMAAYNGEEYLLKQVESILNQQGVEVDVFISVDRSTDSTSQICQRLVAIHENIHLLSLGLRFGCAAKNFYRLLRDVNFESYDYVSFADQDDIWLEDKLTTAISKIEEHNVDAYSSNVTAFWEDGRELLIEKSQPQREFDYLFEAAGPGCTYVFKKHLAQKIKAFLLQNPKSDNFILHDWLCYAFARINGYNWFIDSQSKMRYRQHQLNQVGVNNSLTSLWHRAKYVLFKDGLSQVALLLSLFEPEMLPSKLRKWQKFGFFERFSMIFSTNQLRRKSNERFFVVIVLIISLFKGVSR